MPLALSTKHRIVPPPRGGPYDLFVRRADGLVINDVSATYSFPSKLKGTQITASENHPSWLSRKTGSFTGDVGGPFRTQRTFAEINPSIVQLHHVQPGTTPQRNVTGDYSGPVLPIDPALAAVAFPPSYESSDSLLVSLGTEAIAKVKPTKSPADVSTALGELVREGLPSLVGASLWEQKTRKARQQAAHEYLNLEFGWGPLIRDVGDFLSAVKDFRDVLEQYERDAGRIVRRRFEFPTEEEVTETVAVSDVRAFMPIVWGGFATPGSPSGKVVRVATKSRKRWFSGAFTYYLDEEFYSTSKIREYARKAEIAFGTDITPEVLWNLAPWSWAADWIGNTGAVISNLTDLSKDGLVLRYGYMMEHSVSSYAYHLAGPTGYHGVPTPPPLVLTVEVKKRVKATPFGFGLTWEGFSPRQLAILAALGINKGK